MDNKRTIRDDQGREYDIDRDSGRLDERGNDSPLENLVETGIDCTIGVVERLIR